MSAPTPPVPAAVPLMTSHILSHLPPSPRSSPLFVLLQGPQGSGKTFLCTSISSALRSPPHNLRVAVLSIDDLYLPHAGLRKVAREHPDNPLLTGRGQPGTHDLDLGWRLFHRLRLAEEAHTTILPLFDKSLFSGEGDRAQEGVPVFGRPDVVLVEGWCTGFYPLSTDELERRYEERESTNGPKLPEHEIGHVAVINEYLKQYAQDWWSNFSVFVQITPENLAYVHEWRLQQEHNMKAANGGKGMTDEQVKAFVHRYLPGYYYFSDGVDKGYDVGKPEVPAASNGATEGEEGEEVKKEGQGGTPWQGRGLRVVIDRQRNVVRTENF